jgi:hypothetical protein
MIMGQHNIRSKFRVYFILSSLKHQRYIAPATLDKKPEAIHIRIPITGDILNIIWQS